MTDIDFESVFGFKTPTQEEAEAAADAAQLRVTNNGDATGMMAFFSVPCIRENSLAFIDGTAQEMSDGEIDVQKARMLVLGGFVAAIEYMAAIRLARD